MSKNLQKTLAGALATISTLSIATPVMATSVDIDTLYKNAYDAMQKARETETQTDINAAMELIWQLRHVGDEKNDENLINAACTWSSLVDEVQHPKLVKIVDAITKAQETGRQADINAAFATIEPELPAVWRSSYTSAIDLVQQELQNKLVVAVEKAEADRTGETVKAARELVDEVLTADNEAMVEWANIFAGRLDSIVLDGTDNDDYLIDQEIADLNITDIEVNKKKIKIVFTETTKSLDDVTLTILDNNGKEVKVKSIETIKKGDTTATFEFVNYLSETPTGVWNVNGVSFNLTEKAFINEVKEASDAEVLKTVLAKKQYKDLVSYNENRIEDYFEALTSAESLEEVKDIQNIIDAVDAKLDEEEENNEELVKYIKLLKKVVKNATEDQLFNELSSKFENVNKDLVEKYREDLATILSGDVVSLEDIQDVIDKVNEKNAIEEITKAREALVNALEGDDKKAILEALQNPLLGLNNVKAENIDHYVLDKTNIKNELDTGLEKADEYLNMINEKADVINATNLKDMLTALSKFAETRNLGDFNNLSTGKKPDTAEELLNILSSKEEYSITALESKVAKANTIVEGKLDALKTALESLAEKRGDVTTIKEEDKTTDLRNALKAIIGDDISVVQADAFYDNSINNGQLTSYTNYTQVRAVFNK